MLPKLREKEKQRKGRNMAGDFSCSGVCNETKTKTRLRFEKICKRINLSPGYPYNADTNKYGGHLVKQSHWGFWQEAVCYAKLKD